MGVKDIESASEIAKQALPIPKTQTREEWESPTPVSGLKSMGGDKNPGAETGNDAKKESDLKEIQDTLEKVNKSLNIKNIALNYSVDEKTKDIVIKVVEKDSDRVIRQIPPEQVLKLRGRIKELLGVIFDENI
jgi:uncharacterized FlaG/YvyC family protein